eukprot:UN17524
MFRLLGMPTRIENGTIELEIPHVVCKKGDILRPEQCKLLKLWHKKWQRFQCKHVQYGMKKK